jgi:protein O-GlcNAc transferase
MMQLTHVGLAELVAHSGEEYVQIARRLATDLPRLAKMRAALRERMEKSPLMDGARFARNVERVYREIWREWCANPASP